MDSRAPGPPYQRAPALFYAPGQYIPQVPSFATMAAFFGARLGAKLLFKQGSMK